MHRPASPIQAALPPLDQIANKIHEAWTNLDNAASYSGNVEAILDRAIPTYTVHRPKRNNFKRRAVVVPGPFHSAQTDLIDYIKNGPSNYNYKHILVVVMIFSGKGYTRALPDKKAKTVVAALDSIFGTMNAGERPRFLGADQGSEYFKYGKPNKELAVMLKKYKMVAYPLFKPVKAGVAERWNQKLKKRLQAYMDEKNTKRWVDGLAKMTQNINNTELETIKMAPADVDEQDRDYVRRQRYSFKKDKTKCELQAGDIVKVVLDKDRLGVKGYEKK